MLISRSFARITMVAGCLASETSHGPRWPSWNCTVHVWLYAWPSFCSRFCAFLFVVQIFQVKQPIELSIRQRKFEQSVDALRMFITLQKNWHYGKLLQLWWVVGQPVLWRVTADVCLDLFRLNAPQFCQLSWLHSSFSNNYCNCQIYRITFADECVSEQNHRIYQITQHFKTSSTNAERKLYL